MKTYVVYHANCVDGFGAAFAAWKVLKESATYIPLNHYDPLPDFEKGSRVYCIDFCFKKEEILSLIEHSELIIIDHHLSERKAVEDILHLQHKNLTMIFNMEESGAMLAWKYFHNTPAPDFFPYIEDRDLGKYTMPYTKEIISVLMMKPKEFELWDKLCTDDLLREGLLFAKIQDQIMKETLDRHHFAEIDGVIVPVVNSTCFWSDITFKLLDLYPQSPFVAAYYAVDGERVKWSLRSKEGSSVDVSQISKTYGGGGHKHSGGFTADKNFISFKRINLAAA